MTVQTSWTNEKTQQCRSLIGTALKDGQDRPETQYTTEESATFMSDPTRAVKCMIKRLREHYCEASVHRWSFEMQCEVRVVKGAHWEGELEGLSTTGAWIYFGGYLLETYSSSQQIVALSTEESEYISTKDVVHALVIRSVLADSWACNGRETWSWPRASLGCAIIVAAAVVGRRRGSLVSPFEPAWRTQRGRLVVEDDRFDFAFERNTPSTTNEFIELELTDGGSKFPLD